jgi:hypothetical protein
VLFDETLRFLRVLLLLKINDRDISASLANAIATARSIPLSPPVAFASSAFGHGFILILTLPAAGASWHCEGNSHFGRPLATPEGQVTL